MPNFMPYKPIRPTTDEKGNTLFYRTHISDEFSTYNPYDLLNIQTQILLYRWVLSLEFTNMVSINNLHEYIFYEHPEISKRRLGMTILQSLIYDPRLLKGKTLDNAKACPCYLFNNPWELAFGLEWMMCMWLPKIICSEDPEDVRREFDTLILAKEEDLVDLYFRPWTEIQGDVTPPDFSWVDLWNYFGWEKEFIPQPKRERPKLVSV